MDFGNKKTMKKYFFKKLVFPNCEISFQINLFRQDLKGFCFVKNDRKY